MINTPLPFQHPLAQAITEIVGIGAESLPMAVTTDVIGDNHATARRFSGKVAKQYWLPTALTGAKPRTAQIFLNAEGQLPQYRLQPVVPADIDAVLT